MKCSHSTYCPDNVCTIDTWHCRNEFGTKCKTEEELDVGTRKTTGKKQESEDRGS